jgi:hypothetical protein
MRELYSPVGRAAPLEDAWDVGGQRVGVRAQEQVDMIRLNRQPDDRPVMVSRHLSNDLLQPDTDWSHRHLTAPLGTPVEVVHHQVDTVLFVLVAHADSIVHHNTACKASGPVIPWLQPRGFLAHFCKRGSVRRACAGPVAEHVGLHEALGRRGMGRIGQAAPQELTGM